jgi:amino acid adenylation domain-containing protein
MGNVIGLREICEAEPSGAAIGHGVHGRVDELFELTAIERVGEIAVTYESEEITYGALHTASSVLAVRLRSLGVRPGTVVGICMDRSIAMVTALLAVFKAGAAYLPLDPAYPAERLAFMEADASPLVIITQSHLRRNFGFSTAYVLCVDDTAELEVLDSGPVSSFGNTASSDVAYVLYTSGSTGKPKGVQITHRALTNMLVAVSNELALTPSDVVLATTTISFDISTFEIFAPLIVGARLVLASRSVSIDGKLLGRTLGDHGVTVLQATPTGWRILLEAGWEGHTGLKMLSAGEPLTRVVAQRLLERGADLWNLYGPTETTVYATAKRIVDSTNITVGRPLPNCTAFVLDDNRNPQPEGEAGELYIGGICVGPGYLNRPELTSERFIADPFSNVAGARIYRTGDLARVLPSGEVDVLGRADNQVKMRGYRIELEEVEAVLDDHPSITKSVAKVVSLPEEEECLIAYVVVKVGVGHNDADLRRHASRRLPLYMVPTAFQVVHSFLLTPNGKVDRKALPRYAPSESLRMGKGVKNESPEQTVLRCWRKVLNYPKLTLDQNFFEAGGQSLAAVRMLTEINEQLNVNIQVSHLTEAPTVRKFAMLVGADTARRTRCLVLMQPEGLLPPLYLVHHLLGDVLIYRTIATLFAPHRKVFGIQPPNALAQQAPICSIPALASAYVSEILKQYIAGPVHLAGFSSGSIIAFEMARQLQSQGYEVGLLALIDGPIPPENAPAPTLVAITKTMRRKLFKILFKMKDELAEGPKQFVMKRLRSIRLNYQVRKLLRSGAQHGITTEQVLMLAEKSYKPSPYSGPALLLRFRDEAWGYGPDPLMGWSGLVQRGIQVVDLEGGHMSGMGPEGAPAIASELKLAMVRYDAYTPFQKLTSTHRVLDV